MVIHLSDIYVERLFNEVFVLNITTFNLKRLILRSYINFTAYFNHWHSRILDIIDSFDPIALHFITQFSWDLCKHNFRIVVVAWVTFRRNYDKIYIWPGKT